MLTDFFFRESAGDEILGWKNGLQPEEKILSQKNTKIESFYKE